MKISSAIKEYIRSEVSVRAETVERELATKVEERHAAYDEAKSAVKAKFVELITPHIKAMAPELEKLGLDGTKVRACCYCSTKESTNLKGTLLERVNSTDFYLVDPVLDKLQKAKREFARNKDKAVLRLVAKLELNKITVEKLDEAIDEEVKGLAS